MSSYSSSTSSRNTSPATSPTPSRQIGCSSSASSQRSGFNSMSASTTLTNPYSTCAYPSWPCGSALLNKTSGTPSSYVSDEDLFGDDDEAYLSEPPPPPRPAEAYLARPLLPPVVPIKPRHCSTSSKKKRRSSTKAKE